MSKTLVKRGYKYRFYPTGQQQQKLLRTFGCVRLVYNKALEARTAAWYTDQRRVTYVQTSALLTEWKKSEDLSFLNEVSSVPLQQVLRHLQGAFSNFFAKRAKYPRFKSRKTPRRSAEYTRSGFRWRDGTLTLAKVTEPLDIVWSRPLPEGAEPSTVTVSRDSAGRWFVSILVEASTTHYPLLEYKAEWYGRDVIAIDQWFPSSKTCSTCGALAGAMLLSVREWTCRCGTTHDRDINAARNILAAGLAVSACGDGVRPNRR